MSFKPIDVPLKQVCKTIVELIRKMVELWTLWGNWCYTIEYVYKSWKCKKLDFSDNFLIDQIMTLAKPILMSLKLLRMKSIGYLA